jgi:elongation factor G
MLERGSFHPVDSTELAFRYAAQQAFDQGFAQANPTILEPVMLLEVDTPSDYLGRIQGKLLSHRAVLLGTEAREGEIVLRAKVPLAELFGYSTELRSLSHGMATFTSEFAEYQPLPESLIQLL